MRRHGRDVDDDPERHEQGRHGGPDFDPGFVRGERGRVWNEWSRTQNPVMERGEEEGQAAISGMAAVMSLYLCVCDVGVHTA